MENAALSELLKTKMQKIFFIVSLSLLVVACADGGGVSSSKQERVASQLSQIVSDPNILDYLAEEAARAGVSRIQVVNNATISRKCKSRNAYGCSVWSTGTKV